MSSLTIPADRFDRLSDWFNPILVKETRQALKSRLFIATFMLLLITSWLICVFGVAVNTAALEYGTPGNDFFQSFYFVLAAAVLIVVPFSAFRSLLTEQDAQTYELLSITALHPRQIVLGKLCNSIVQILVFYCAISPFVAFASLLQGFDLIVTVVLMTSLLGVSVLLCMFSLMMSTVARYRQLQAISSLFIFGGLMSVFPMMIGLSFSLRHEAPELNWAFLFVWGAVWLIGASYFILFLQITVAQLMFAAANRSSGIRITAVAQFLLFWALLFGSMLFWPSTFDPEMLNMGLFMSIWHWAIFGFFFAMERDELSRRIRRDLPKSALRRLLMALFMPGGTRGYALVLANLLLLGVLNSWVNSVYASLHDSVFQVINGLLLYLTIYLGMGCLLTRNLLKYSREMQPMHGRTILIVLFAFGLIIPHLMLWVGGYYETYNPEYHLLLVTNPISTLSEIAQGRYATGNAIAVLMLAAVVAVGLNLLPIMRSLQEVLFPKRPPVSATSPPATTQAPVPLTASGDVG